MITYYLTLSRVFPSGHNRAGEPTNFENAFLAGQKPRLDKNQKGFRKIHTIRANYDFWAKRFEKINSGNAQLSIREWVGKPYGKGSTQREIARLSRWDGIGLQKLTIEERMYGRFHYVDGNWAFTNILSNNDGLSLEDWWNWFDFYDLSKPLAIIHFTKFRY